MRGSVVRRFCGRAVESTSVRSKPGGQEVAMLPFVACLMLIGEWKGMLLSLVVAKMTARLSLTV
jgi:hypothetical protein